MVNIGRFIFNITGVMSKKGIVKNTDRIGRAVSERVSRNGTITLAEIQEIMDTTLGKAAKKIRLTSTKDEFVKACQDGMRLPKEYAEAMYNRCVAASLPNQGKSAIVNYKLDRYTPQQMSGVISHELEHALYQTVSYDIKKANFIRRIPILGKRLQEKALSKSKLVNTVVQDTQSFLLNDILHMNPGGAVGLTSVKRGTSGLLEHTGFKSEKELQNRIRELLYERKILSTTSDKDNNLALKVIRRSLKDERRAYTTGGSSERIWHQLEGDNPDNLANYSEMAADLYGQALKVVKQEMKKNRTNRLKQFFGMKVDKSEEMGIVKKAQEEFMATVKPVKRATTTEIASKEKIRQMHEELIKNGELENAKFLEDKFKWLKDTPTT